MAFLFHLVVTYSMDNKAFNHIVAASTSSWLQEHVADMSERYRALLLKLTLSQSSSSSYFMYISFISEKKELQNYQLKVKARK